MRWLFFILIFSGSALCISSTSTTFKVSTKTPETVDKDLFYGPSEDGKALESIPAVLPHFKRNNCTEILQGTEFSPKTRISSNNGFVDTVIRSYNHHHNLVLRPDDIWTAIMTQLSFYINAHAEEFRGKFVNFEGKKELVVRMPGSLRSFQYGHLVEKMSKEIHRHLVDSDVKSWLLPNFTTTTENDLVSSGVVFMASMKKYFTYRFGTSCGIPSVTLEGTLADWEDILSRLEKLKEYKLEKWYKLLKPILTQFVRAKKGEVDLDFWQRIVNYRFEGSGSDSISGWITAFCVFDADGRWQGKTSLSSGEVSDRSWSVIGTDDIPTGVVEVDVTIEDNKGEYNSSMFAGHIAVEVQEDNKTLKPTIGWVICLKPLAPEEAGGNEDDPGVSSGSEL